MKATLCASSLVVLLVGCTPMTVRHDYDPDVDFSAFQTFDWMPKPETDERAKSMKSRTTSTGRSRKF